MGRPPRPSGTPSSRRPADDSPDGPRWPRYVAMTRAKQWLVVTHAASSTSSRRRPRYLAYIYLVFSVYAEPLARARRPARLRRSCRAVCCRRRRDGVDACIGWGGTFEEPNTRKTLFTPCESPFSNVW